MFDPTLSKGDVDYASFAAAGADVNIVATTDGVFRYVAPRCEHVFGWPPVALEGRSEDDFVHPDDVGAIHANRVQLITGEVGTTSYRFRCNDDTFRWVEATSHRVKADDYAVVVLNLRDITERQSREAVREHRAVTDPLTGVANRTVLMDRLNQGLRRLRRSGGVLGVLYIDLDRFKIINDSLGHHVGDHILLQMADRLNRYLRPTDTVARLGGDEFVIVADVVASEQAVRDLAERVVKDGREPFRIGNDAYECTVSIGVACTSDPEKSANDMLRDADLALYRAKEKGRDRADFFDESLHTQALDRLTTERLVRRALSENRVIVEYQPIVDLAKWKYVGVESLVRIDDPDEGLLPPALFLEAAEQNGLLSDIVELVLFDAVANIAAWNGHHGSSAPPNVAINVTARHLADVSFPQSITDRCIAARISPANLSIEVTERVLIEASRSALTVLRALRLAGMRVGLDDFGTGYSSLSYLRQFPLDFLKIDRSFIADLERGESERVIVVAIIGLAHALKLDVVAEGVETVTQLRTLQDLECDYVQGFLFSPSLASKSVNATITAGPDPALRDGEVISHPACVAVRSKYGASSANASVPRR